MIKQLFVILLIMICFTSCIDHYYEKKFISQHEFEDFSLFKGVSVFIRGGDCNRDPIIMINAPHLIKDTAKIGLYAVTLDKTTNQIIKTDWTLADYNVNADTVRLQQLAQSFAKYKIPGLYVDTMYNVFVYLKDVETLGLVRFKNIKKMQKYNIPKRYRDVKWVNIKSNWYRPN